MQTSNSVLTALQSSDAPHSRATVSHRILSCSCRLQASMMQLLPLSRSRAASLIVVFVRSESSYLGCILRRSSRQTKAVCFSLEHSILASVDFPAPHGPENTINVFTCRFLLQRCFGELHSVVRRSCASGASTLAQLAYSSGISHRAPGFLPVHRHEARRGGPSVCQRCASSTTRASLNPRACAMRGTWNSAAAGVMSGSKPDAKVVTSSTGIG